MRKVPPQPWPSFGTGIAHHAGESQYPDLWKEYVGGFLWPARNCIDPGPNRMDGACTASTAIVQTPIGPGADTSIAGASQVTWTYPSTGRTKWKIDPPFTVVCAIYRYWSGSDNGWIFVSDVKAPANTYYRGWMCGFDYSTWTSFIHWGDNTSTNSVASMGVIAEDGTGHGPPSTSVSDWFIYGMRCRALTGTSDCDWWYDGERNNGGYTAANTGITMTHVDLSATNFGKNNNVAQNFISPVFHLWNRELTDAEMALTGNDVFAHLRPSSWRRRTRIGKAPSVGRVVTLGGPAIRGTRIILAG